jgi:predicted nucleic-acid-binding protein
MIGLDTNVLVRYLTQDDPEQSLRANRLIESCCTRKEPGRISLIVLCELVWVLRGAYGYQKSLVTNALEQILFSRELEVENAPIAASALSAYRKGSADFADYVIVFCNRSSGCELTYSFDKKLGKHRLVRIP